MSQQASSSPAFSSDSSISYGPSTSDEAEASALEPLADALIKQRAEAVFSCAGAFEVDNQHPVSICWWDGDRDASDSLISMARLVGDATSTETLYPPLRRLVDACQPATSSFSQGGSPDSIQERYGRAGEMDTDHFFTDFCPHKLGIVEIIQKMFYPGRVGARGQFRAELHKLHVYSEGDVAILPVDTPPRGEGQFGSLVVCLPVQFEGGTLAIHHRGRHENRVWMDKSASHVQWAAFYSVCEHEVLPVMSGHRVTLTYNLLNTGRQMAMRTLQSLTPSIPMAGLEACFRSVIGNPNLLPGGGRLGIHSAHFYAHAASNASHRKISGSLKGKDLALESVLRRCNLSFRLCTAICSRFPGKRGYKNVNQTLDPWFEDFSPYVRWPGKKIWRHSDVGGIVVGNIQPGENMELIEDVHTCDDWSDEASGLYIGNLAQDIYWLGKPRNNTLDGQLTYMALRSNLAVPNNLTLRQAFTALVFIVQIPPFAQRSQLFNTAEPPNGVPPNGEPAIDET